MNCHINSLHHSVILTNGDLIRLQLCQQSRASLNVSIFKTCTIHDKKQICPHAPALQNSLKDACSLPTDTQGLQKLQHFKKSSCTVQHFSIKLEFVREGLYHMRRTVGLCSPICSCHKALYTGTFSGDRLKYQI